MGTSGYGKFHNYSSGEKESQGGGKGSKKGNQCPELIENINLEDVELAEYFYNHKDVPSIGNKVEVSSQTQNGRLVVINCDTKEIIGNIPTDHNYLLKCIQGGMTYIGFIVNSGLSPISFIVVTLNGK